MIKLYDGIRGGGVMGQNNGKLGDWNRKNGRGKGCEMVGVSKPGTNKVNSRREKKKLN